MLKMFPLSVFSLVAAILQTTSAEPAEHKLGYQKIFAASSLTTTFTDISTLTSVVPYTCYTTKASTKVCKGRKKRRILRNIENVKEDFGNIADISSSLADELPNMEDSTTKNMGAAEKFYFTVWKTSMTTMTVTSYSYNRSITLSILAACTNPSFTALPISC